MPKTCYFLGIDVGTTAVKAAIFNATGKLLRVAARPYKLLTPRPGWAEQDPDDWIRCLRACAREVTRGKGQKVEAVGLSSQGGTMVLLDGEGQPLCRALTWLDTRPERLAEDIIPGHAAHDVYKTTGWSSLAALPLAKLFWLREHRAALMRRCRHIAFTGDYVLLRMTGRQAIDPSSAAITQLYDFAKGEWCDLYLRATGITREMLPVIEPSADVVGGLSSQFARSLNLRPGTPVITGAHDQYASAFGIDASRPGHAMLATGTAWVQLAISAYPALTADERISVSPAAFGGRWGALKAVSFAGASLNWLRGLCQLPGFKELDAAASVAGRGANGLRFIPARTFASERGLFFGLDLSHSRGDMARAIMEGVAAATAANLEDLARVTGRVRRVVFTGGATQSKAWPRIVADASGRTIRVIPEFESACAGTARLAAVGVGRGEEFLPRVKEILVRPRRRACRFYAELKAELVRAGNALRKV